MRVGWALVGSALLLTLAVPALAAPGTIAVRAELPLQVDGPHEARGEGSEVLVEGTDGTLAATLYAEDGHAWRYVHRMWGYVNHNDPKLGIVYDEEVQRLPLRLDGGALLTVAERRPGFQLLASDAELVLSSTGSDGGSLLVGALASAKTVERPLDEMLWVHLGLPSQDDALQHVIPAGSFEARATAAQVTATGPAALFLSDAVVHYTGPDGPTRVLAHFREESRPGTLYNPLTKTWSGPGTHTEYVQEHLRIETRSAQLTLLATGVPVSLFSTQSLLAVDGTAHLPAAAGTVTVIEDGKTTRHDVRSTDLAVGGRFTLRAHDVIASPARATVDGDGELTSVTYAGVAAKYDWSKAAAAAGLGALALAALGWLAFHAKTVGPALGGAIAGYARVSGQEILEHPGRSEVYERVKAYPGISFVQLAGAVGFGQSTLNYHLRVLEKNGYVHSVKDGRYLRFFDRTAGTYAGHRRVAVSALRNDTTAAMARHIRANPGIVQRDLAAAFGVTASTVNWHVTRLAGAGLVTRVRDAHFTRYYVAEGWSQLPADEAARQEHAAATPLLVAHA